MWQKFQDNSQLSYQFWVICLERNISAGSRKSFMKLKAKYSYQKEPILPSAYYLSCISFNHVSMPLLFLFHLTCEETQAQKVKCLDQGDS